MLVSIMSLMMMVVTMVTVGALLEAEAWYAAHPARAASETAQARHHACKSTTATAEASKPAHSAQSPEPTSHSAEATSKSS